MLPSVTGKLCTLGKKTTLCLDLSSLLNTGISNKSGLLVCIKFVYNVAAMCWFMDKLRQSKSDHHQIGYYIFWTSEISTASYSVNQQPTINNSNLLRDSLIALCA